MAASEFTAATNGVWAGLAIGITFLALFLYWRYRAIMSDEVKASCRWIWVPAICAAFHRLFWNFAIWTAPEGQTYNPEITEWRGYLPILVVLMVIGAYKTTVPFVPKQWLSRYRAGMIAWLVFAASGSALLV